MSAPDGGPRADGLSLGFLTACARWSSRGFDRAPARIADTPREVVGVWWLGWAAAACTRAFGKPDARVARPGWAEIGSAPSRGREGAGLLPGGGLPGCGRHAEVGARLCRP